MQSQPTLMLPKIPKRAANTRIDSLLSMQTAVHRIHIRVSSGAVNYGAREVESYRSTQSTRQGRQYVTLQMSN